jgi:hypothetical protein
MRGRQQSGVALCVEHTTELLLVMRRQVRAAVRQAVRFGHQIEHPSRNGIPSSSLFLRKKEEKKTKT